MKEIKLIYNPLAGAGKFEYLLDYTVRSFQDKGYEVDSHKTTCPEDFENFITGQYCHDYDAVIIAGGDGSVNLVVNALLKEGLDIPLGIIPAGTSNDFAKHLGMPMDLKKAIDSLSQISVRRVDVGEVNGRYFMNVCAGGIFTDISYRVDLRAKNILGKFAYYMEGIRDLPRLKSMNLRVMAQDIDIAEDFYLYLVLNGSSVGGFHRVGGPACIDDGLLDFVGFRAMELSALPMIYAKLLAGTHLNDRRVISFQTSELRIERMGGNIVHMDADVDGEKGPEYPLSISVLPHQLQILSPI